MKKGEIKIAVTTVTVTAEEKERDCSDQDDWLISNRFNVEGNLMTHLDKARKTAALSCSLLVAILSAQAANGDSDSGKDRDHDRGYDRPTHSSTIALSRNNRLLWSVNPDSDTVSVIRTDTNRLVAKIDVGDEPRSIALTPDNRYAYVANAAGNNVTVIKIRNRRPAKFRASVDRRVGRRGELTTGAEPAAIVVSPDGERVFVANSSQDTVTVINARKRKIIGSVNLRSSLCNVGGSDRHFQPRAMAVTEDNRTLYVTRFLSFTHDNGAQANDHGKEGVVCRIDIDTDSRVIAGYTPSAAIVLPASDTGFVDRLGRSTSAFPNQLQSIVIRDGYAYLPNIAASPSGPQRFDTNTQAYVNQISGIGGSESHGGAINLHLGGRDPEEGKQELYFANPWGIAFTSQKSDGHAYVIAAGSDLLVKLRAQADGALGFTVDDDTTRYIDLNDPDNPATSGHNAGKNPIGVVINDSGDTAYVLNYISRNVSVVDLESDAVVKVVRADRLPEPGSHEEVLQVGAEMFFSSRGHFVRPEGASGSSRDRLSEKGRQNCASCHAGGLTDGVIWQFASGPRKTIAVNGTFNPRDPSDQRIINASAVFDEVEDADFNTRRVSSGGPLDVPRTCVESPPVTGVVESTNDPDHGLILGEEGDFEFAPCVLNQFAKPNTNRPQPRVQLPGGGLPVKAHDALIEWQRVSIRTPNRPMTRQELRAAKGDVTGGIDARDISAGRQLFEAANCEACHGGGKWTKSKKDFISPPAPEEIAREDGATNANQFQFLPRFLTDIGSYNLNVAGAGNQIDGYPLIGGIEKDSNGLDALGFDYNGDGKGSGFNTPSLLGAYNVPPYYHNGACETLQCVLSDVSHRSAGQTDGQADPLSTAAARSKLVSYLEAIDEGTTPH